MLSSRERVESWKRWEIVALLGHTPNRIANYVVGIYGPDYALPPIWHVGYNAPSHFCSR